MFCLKLQKSKEHITFLKIISYRPDMIFEQRRKNVLKNMLRLSPRNNEEK